MAASRTSSVANERIAFNMVFSGGRRRAMMSLAAVSLVVGSLTAMHSTGVEAAHKAALSTLKPVVLIVDTHIMGTALVTSTALQRGGTALGLSQNLLAPTSVPTGTQLYSLSIQRPLLGFTAGVATLGYASTKTGQYLFQIDEGPVPFYFGKAKITRSTINGHSAIMYDLGTIGSNHLVAITWSLGSFKFYDITSNIGKSKLTTANMLKIAASVPLQ